MSTVPHYFERVRANAEARWIQLERDPELAAPWHQLFKQVQSPRHIVSELLQNADDAEATQASVRIEGSAFVFEHNGVDFQEEHFQSLCRFGYSNKRLLHTIGFRGIGFKSTFSLGDTVELHTPTLSVRFNKNRFTEPVWCGESTHTNSTIVRVEICDSHRRRELEKNLNEWKKSPLSLLFFRNIRRLQVEDTVLHWKAAGRGPIPGTELMTLNGDEDNPYLVARSGLEPFPEEALAEIREERMTGTNDTLDFPPCRVELVLGGNGRLYVVLPTGVKTELPFACNAPFIQDPARVKIKDPETSPTNRWLLERLGKLAAQTMLAWLDVRELDSSERVKAYALMPRKDLDSDSLEGGCGAAVERAFAEAIEDQNVLLTEEGATVRSKQALSVPQFLFEVWPDENLAPILGTHSHPPLCQLVSQGDREKLVDWDLLEAIALSRIAKALIEHRMPCPRSWERLVELWVNLESEFISYQKSYQAKHIKAFPDQQKQHLYSANELVRLGEKRLLQSEEDWEFLSKYLRVLNPNCTRYVTEVRRNAEQTEDDDLQERVDACESVLKAAGLAEASDVSTVIERVANAVFAPAEVPGDACVRIAQIAAKLGAEARSSFKFLACNDLLTPVSQTVLFDEHEELAQFLPDEWYNKHVLAPVYKNYHSCSPDEWRRWVENGRSGLHTFAPFIKSSQRLYGDKTIAGLLEKHGSTDRYDKVYKSSYYSMKDWDFGSNIWEFWSEASQSDGTYWGRLFERVLRLPPSFLAEAKGSEFYQVSNAGTERYLATGLPSWILKFRELPCLRDTHGQYHKPMDLMRRTPETEALLEVEPFVDARLDNERTRLLLDMLGVNSTPTGPEKVLNRLRMLGGVADVPPEEVEKWYRRLDSLVNQCTTKQLAELQQIFSDERLILDADGTWQYATGVFVYADEEDVPDAALVRPSVRNLTLWEKLGVKERPTFEAALEWLDWFGPDDALDPNDVRRIRALLRRYSDRVWEHCGHWLNLSGRWVPVNTLKYALTMQSLASWGHLFPAIKDATANFQMLSVERLSEAPFNRFLPLASVIDEQFEGRVDSVGSPERPPWLNGFGSLMTRVRVDSEEQQAQVRSLANVLAVLEVQRARSIRMIPYIDGAPAGTPRETDILLSRRVLYVRDLPNARLAKIIPDFLGQKFGRQDIRAALDYCFGRDLIAVQEYLEENFDLELSLEATEPPEDTTEEGFKGTETVRIATRPEDSAYAGGPTDATLKGEDLGYNGDDSAMEDDWEDGATPNSTLDGSPSEDLSHSDEGLPWSAVESRSLVSDPEPQKESAPEKKAPTERMPDLVERYALLQGFEKVDNKRFKSFAGNIIQRSGDEVFPWEHLSPGGEVLERYRSTRKCLDKEPIELPAEAWGMLAKFPHEYALVLENYEGIPVATLGIDLLDLQEQDRLKLYPASYRLVQEG